MLFRIVGLLIIFLIVSSCAYKNSESGPKVGLLCTSETLIRERLDLVKNSQEKDTYCIDKSSMLDVVILKKVDYTEDMPDELLELSKEWLFVEHDANFAAKLNYDAQVSQKEILEELTSGVDEVKVFYLICDDRFVMSMLMVDKIENGAFRLVVDDGQSGLIEQFCRN